MNRSTNTKMTAETKLVIWVLPPTLTWTRVLPIEAADGGHEKKAPKMFEVPCDKSKEIIVCTAYVVL